VVQIIGNGEYMKKIQFDQDFFGRIWCNQFFVLLSLVPSLGCLPVSQSAHAGFTPSAISDSTSSGEPADRPIVQDAELVLDGDADDLPQLAREEDSSDSGLVPSSPSVSSPEVVGEALATDDELTPGVVAAVSGGVQKYNLVSDIDETVIATGVTSYWEMLRRVWEGRPSYAGMAELYQALAKNAERIIYISGSDVRMKRSLEELLFSYSSFPRGEIALRVWGWRWDKIDDFKLRELNRVSKENDLPYLFFGDDADKDPLVLEKFAQAHPGKRILASYIHRVLTPKSRLPSSMFGYRTPFEVAMQEFEVGRIPAEDVLTVGEVLLREQTVDRIFPHYLPCPTGLEFKLGPKGRLQPDISTMSVTLAKHLNHLCKQELLENPSEEVPLSVSPLES